MRKDRVVRRLDIKPILSVGSSTDETAESPAPPAYPSVPPPDTIVLSTSIVYSSGTPLARITASWNAPPAADPVVTSYYVQISTSSSFLDGVTATYPAHTNSATLDGLKPNTHYYIRIATRVSGVLSDWSESADITTPLDTTPPSAPSSLAAAFVNAGDLLITWTNPSEANFRNVEISIYESASKSTLYWRAYSASGRYVFTAAMNGQATSYAYDPSLYVELRSRNWHEYYSGAATASATLAAPSAPAGLTTSWDSDSGTAGPDCAISWTAVAGLRYRLTIDGVARDLGASSRYTYTLDTNRAEHGGTPDPVLSLSLVAIDGLLQTSSAATTTATNAAPSAPTVTLTDGMGFILARVTSSPPADFAAYEYAWKLGGTPQLTLESAAAEQQYEAATAGTWTVAVRVKDAFGQYSSATTSAAVVHDPLTVALLRAGAQYTDDLGTSATALAALKDDVLSSGGISYSAVAPSLRATATANDTAVTQLTIPVPSGTQNGDGLILALAVRGGSGTTVSTPAGWTLILTQNQSTGVRLAIFRRIAASEPASYTVSWTGGSFDADGAIYAAQNVDALNLVEASNSQGNAASTSVAAPSITTTSANTLLLFIGAAQGGPTWTPPGGETERADVQSGGTNKISLTIAEETLASAGATGTRTATISSSQQSVGALVALRGSWHWTQQEEPFIARRRNITLAATAGEGYIGISQDGTTWSWYAGPLGADGRTLTAVASETAARLAPAALPSNGRLDLPAMADARYIKLGHRATSGSSYTLREFYARRLVQTDDFEAESVTAIAIKAGTITADRLSATAIDGMTITGATIRTSSTNPAVQITTSGLRLDALDFGNISASATTLRWEKTGTTTQLAGLIGYYSGAFQELDITANALAGTADGIVRLIGEGRTASAVLDAKGSNSAGGQSIVLWSGIGTAWLVATPSGVTIDALNLGSKSGAASGEIKAATVTSDILVGLQSDSATNTAPTALLLRHRTSGTAAAGFGVKTTFQANSDTTADQTQAEIASSWATATNASRKARVQFYAYDTAARECMRIEASGTAPMIGFLGAAAVVQQSIGAAAPAGGTGATAGAYDTAAHRDAMITLVNNMRTALLNLGLCV